MTVSLTKSRIEIYLRTIGLILLIAGSVWFIFPLVWMVSTSLKADTELFVYPPKWIPPSWQWQNYPKALSEMRFVLLLKNTLVIVALNLAGTLLSCSLVAYSFARLRWPGRDICFIILLSTMMLPPQVTMIPVFILFRSLGWIDTYLPLTVPAFFAAGVFFVFLLRQFFLTIPMDLEDAAQIDGAAPFTIYWKIILPLAKPALATVAIFTFVGTWNDFMGPLIYLSSETKKTLALGLQVFSSTHNTEWNLLMAAALVILLPILVIFFLCQRLFVQGITLTGIKG